MQNSIFENGDRRNVTIAVMKSYMGFQLAYLHLTLTNSNGQCQDHGDVYDEYLGNGDI